MERRHHSVKRIAARKRCSVTEAVYWYNIAPKDGADPSTSPANRLYSYNVHVYGIDHTSPEEPSGTGNPYKVGDAVWVRPPSNRCDTRFFPGTVTNVTSDLAVEVNGVSRHICDLRRATSSACIPEAVEENEILSDDDGLLMSVPPPSPRHDFDSDAEKLRPLTPEQSSPRRSLRERQPPDRYSP